jgi:hypothetical protein
MIKVDKEIQDHLNELNFILVNRSVELEQRIKSTNNVTDKESYKKEFDELVKSDMVKLKNIQSVFETMKKNTLKLQDQHCKNEAMKQLNTTKQQINSFIQIMKTIVSKVNNEKLNLSFL